MQKEEKIESNNKLDIIDDALIFKFINPNNNDLLSKMSGYDLQDLITLIDKYYIKLRKQLGIDQSITFGLELELEKAKVDKIQKKLNEKKLDNSWKTKKDSTLVRGIEINSPILRDSQIAWKDLEEVCSLARPLAKIGPNSSGHIHIGTQTIGSNKENWLNFIKIWSVYENVIYRFVYGEFLTGRPSISKYAKPIAKTLWQDYEQLKKENASLEAIISTISHERLQAINFLNVSQKNINNFSNYNTIEFRCPNGSLNSVIWQNNVNFLTKLLIYSKNSSFNDELVQERHQLNLYKYVDLKLYNEIYLEQALELCDMVFTNNYDKIYFLKQYLKSFQESKSNKKYQKARSLTKKTIRNN